MKLLGKLAVVVALPLLVIRAAEADLILYENPWTGYVGSQCYFECGTVFNTPDFYQINQVAENFALSDDSTIGEVTFGARIDLDRTENEPKYTDMTVNWFIWSGPGSSVTDKPSDNLIASGSTNPIVTLLEDLEDGDDSRHNYHTADLSLDIPNLDLIAGDYWLSLDVTPIAGENWDISWALTDAGDFISAYSSIYYPNFRSHYPDFDRSGFVFSVRGAFPVPEPGTFALLGIGLFGMGLVRRRKRAA